MTVTMGSSEWPLVTISPCPPPSWPLPEIAKTTPLYVSPELLDPQLRYFFQTMSCFDELSEDTDCGRMRVATDTYPCPPPTQTKAVEKQGDAFSSNRGGLLTKVSFSEHSELTTKRSAPEENEFEQLRPQKMVCTTIQDTESLYSGSNILQMSGFDSDSTAEQHADDGLLGGKYWCTCGKSFSRPATLRRHLKQLLDPATHTCPECGMYFTRLDTLERHCKVQHGDGKVECPGCHNRFRRDYLPEHLNCAQREECRMIADSLELDVYGHRMDVRPVTDGFWTSDITDDFVLPLFSKLPEMKTRSSTSTLHEAEFFIYGEGSEDPAETVHGRRGLRARFIPGPGANDEPCTLCGMPLESDTEDLIEHISHHSAELASSEHRCQDCEIDFMFAADLESHLAAARSGTCGLDFLHCFEWEDSTNQGREQCQDTHCHQGHHPPSNSQGHNDNHERMNQLLALWETLQIRAHRVAIARLEARLLLQEQQFQRAYRHTLDEDRIMCLNVLSRVSVGSISSFRSVPARLKYLDSMHDDKAEAIMAVVTAQSRPASLAPPAVDSAGKICSQPERRPTLPILPRFSPSTYIDKVIASRSPGGLKSKASGVFLRTNSMTERVIADARPAANPQEAQDRRREAQIDRLLVDNGFSSLHALHHNLKPHVRCEMLLTVQE